MKETKKKLIEFAEDPVNLQRKIPYKVHDPATLMSQIPEIKLDKDSQPEAYANLSLQITSFQKREKDAISETAIFRTQRAQLREQYEEKAKSFPKGEKATERCSKCDRFWTKLEWTARPYGCKECEFIALDTEDAPFLVVQASEGPPEDRMPPTGDDLKDAGEDLVKALAEEHRPAA